MGRKLAGLIGIVTAVLAFGLTATVEMGHSPVQQDVRHVLAEGKGPTGAGS